MENSYCSSGFYSEVSKPWRSLHICLLWTLLIYSLWLEHIEHFSYNMHAFSCQSRDKDIWAAPKIPSYPPCLHQLATANMREIA